MEISRLCEQSTFIHLFGAGFSPKAENRLLLFEWATAQAISQE